jgi:hypothetical protein
VKTGGGQWFKASLGNKLPRLSSESIEKKKKKDWAFWHAFVILAMQET